METLNIRPTITSYIELQDFLALNPAEIKLIVEKDKSASAGILQQLSDIEAVASFLHYT